MYYQNNEFEMDVLHIVVYKIKKAISLGSLSLPINGPNVLQISERLPYQTEAKSMEKFLENLENSLILVRF